MRHHVATTLLPLTIAVTASAQESGPKRFLGDPLTIQDQGSFFIGGVQNATTFATGPAAGPGATAPAPQQITIGHHRPGKRQSND